MASPHWREKHPAPLGMAGCIKDWSFIRVWLHPHWREQHPALLCMACCIEDWCFIGVWRRHPHWREQHPALSCTACCIKDWCFYQSVATSTLERATSCTFVHGLLHRGLVFYWSVAMSTLERTTSFTFMHGLLHCGLVSYLIGLCGDVHMGEDNILHFCAWHVASRIGI